MINPIPLEYRFLAKFIFLLVMCAASATWSWWLTTDFYQNQILRLENANQIAVQSQLTSQNKILAERAESIRLAEEQHGKDQIDLNRLGADLRRLQLHVPFNGCGAMSGTAGNSANSNGTSGVAAAGIESYLGEVKQSIDDIGTRCAQMNIDAMAVNRKLENR